jgi:two-component system chemotaxis response regulator CheY
MRILVVDDDYVSRTKLKALLATYGDCDAAPNGSIAIDMFEVAHREVIPYNLITLDINMPGMGGLEVMRKIRHWEMKYGIMIAEESKLLAVTSKQDTQTVVKSIKEGCEYYLIKPVTSDNVLVALLKLGFKV